MLAQLVELEKEAQAALYAVADEQALAGWYGAYLGRKGKITEAVKALGSLQREDRPAYGQRVNEAKRLL